MSGSSRQLTLNKGAPEDQVRDLLCVQPTSYLEGGPLMWMMPLYWHVYQKYDYAMILLGQSKSETKFIGPNMEIF